MNAFGWKDTDSEDLTNALTDLIFKMSLPNATFISVDQIVDERPVYEIVLDFYLNEKSWYLLSQIEWMFDKSCFATLRCILDDDLDIYEDVDFESEYAYLHTVDEINEFLVETLRLSRELIQKDMI